MCGSISVARASDSLGSSNFRPVPAFPYCAAMALGTMLSSGLAPFHEAPDDAVQPAGDPPPLEIEQTVLPTIGSSVQICGLTSAEGKPLNGCLGTAIALEAQLRGTVHLHNLVWQALPTSVDVSDPAPSARATNGFDEHSMSASTIAYVAGYCSKPHSN